MSGRMRLAGRLLLLVLLPFAEAAAVYQLFFSVWMTAYLPHEAAEWRLRFFLWGLIGLALPVLWLMLFASLLRLQPARGKGE